MTGTRALVFACVLVGCGDKSKTAPTTPPRGNTAAKPADCTTVVDKLVAYAQHKGNPITAEQRTQMIDGCNQQPAGDPVIACINAATSDDAIDACMSPPKKHGEPHEQLDAAVESLRTYYFVNETFTAQKVPLTPAKACCQFPNKKCPAETAPDQILTGMLGLDLSGERSFQYRFESTFSKAIVEAIGDRDCDGKTVTFRRELEWRKDGNMHITVTDPPEGSD